MGICSYFRKVIDTPFFVIVIVRFSFDFCLVNVFATCNLIELEREYIVITVRKLHGAVKN